MSGNAAPSSDAEEVDLLNTLDYGYWLQSAKAIERRTAQIQAVYWRARTGSSIPSSTSRENIFGISSPHFSTYLNVPDPDGRPIRDALSDTTTLSSVHTPPTSVFDANTTISMSPSLSVAPRSPRSPSQGNLASSSRTLSYQGHSRAQPTSADATSRDSRARYLHSTEDLTERAEGSSSQSILMPSVDTALVFAMEERAKNRPYPLRRRNPRQLQPYMHDRIAYKYQLRLHPEAIVHRPDLERRTAQSPPSAHDLEYGDRAFADPSVSQGPSVSSQHSDGQNNYPSALVSPRTRPRSRRKKSHRPHAFPMKLSRSPSPGPSRLAPFAKPFPVNSSRPARLSSEITSDEDDVGVIGQIGLRLESSIPQSSDLVGDDNLDEARPGKGTRKVSSVVRTSAVSQPLFLEQVRVRATPFYVPARYTDLDQALEKERSQMEASQFLEHDSPRTPSHMIHFDRAASLDRRQILRIAQHLRGRTKNAVPKDIEAFSGQFSHAREKRPPITIDLEDAAMRSALAPLAMRSASSLSPSGLPNKPSRERLHLLSPDDNQAAVLKPPAPSLSCSIRPEDIPFLTAGLRLDDPYLRNGMLRDVLDSFPVSSSQSAANPVFGRNLRSPTITDLEAAVQHACRLVIDPQHRLSEAEEWDISMHRLCSSIATLCRAGHPNSLSDDGMQQLWHVVIHCSSEMLKQAHDIVAADSSVSWADTLHIGWFGLALVLPFCMTNDLPRYMVVFEDRFKDLLSKLLSIDPAITLRSLITPPSQNKIFAVGHHSVSIWIRLIHLSLCPSFFKHSLLWKHTESFFEPLQNYRSGLVQCETIWMAITLLCTLSQFDATGYSTHASHLPPSWSTIILALRAVRLSWNPDIDLLLDPIVAQKRDDYIRLLLSRCLALHQQWGWKLENHGALLIQHLRTIFSTRKFANLIDESATLPSFVLKQNSQLLFATAEHDTAFTMWLKLIAATSQAMSPVEAKKLLGSCLPVGNISIHDLLNPTVSELSMLYSHSWFINILSILDQEWLTNTKSSIISKLLDQLVTGLSSLCIVSLDKEQSVCLLFDSYETQDEYELWSMNITEEDLHTIGIENNSHYQRSCIIAKGIANQIAPAIYTILDTFTYPSNSKLSQAALDWLSVWLECIYVIIKLNVKTWLDFEDENTFFRQSITDKNWKIAQQVRKLLAVIA
ncbi:Mus7/MMS22 family-domain-containing protein [Vararia minispora EC-137]|uniref:Mus7/MMS22 family-domain-containing protein n=1 Tax=Vararia minispora EC-137 TaxID=1314806 RepID=A0ACB8Q8Z3_9AGAM|nr:Mus7/MMS22 family-domain-containing protein [Vararia minispora EC-137]